MESIVKPVKNVILSLWDVLDFRYAWKHRVESKAQVHGIWDIDWFIGGKMIKEGPLFNTFTTEGLAKLLNTEFWTDSKVASKIWYVGAYKNNVTPAVGNTAAVHLGAAGTYGALQATTDIDESAYPSYNTAETATASITNSANKAELTFAGTFTVYGVFLGTASDPTAVDGTLMSAKKLSSAKSVDDGDGAAIQYTISVTTS